MQGPHLDISGATNATQLPLGGEPITVGRHPDNTIVLNDASSSRFHCVIEKHKDGWRVRDLGSSNGTRVNNAKVASTELGAGDVIRIGKVRITFVDPSIEPVDLSTVGVLTEDDVVDDDALPLRAGPSLEKPITEAMENKSQVGVSEPEVVLRELAESMGEKSFTEADIALYNARRAVTHQATGRKAGKSDSSGDTVELFRLILLICFRSRATDIHLEPKNDLAQIRTRVDGTMVDVVRVSTDLGVKLSALVKILSDLDIQHRTIVQEGHFSARVPNVLDGRKTEEDRRIDFRVSFAPSVYGQKLVIRILDTANVPLEVDDLELPKWMADDIKHTLQQDAGMILVCGPTGSGKTTTLYSLVRTIDTAQRNVVTIEDPVEIQIEGVTQLPVDEASGKSFSALLRSVLRQDPDALLVGEIRDPETARIAMQAAITGHLVFSTIHTKDTVSTVFRLLDLGVEPYLIAQGLHLVIAQRLARKLCPHCRQAVKVTAEQLAKMGAAGEGVTRIYAPRGCPRCMGTGFQGRKAIFELLTSTDELQSVIMRSGTIDEMNAAVAKTKFVRLQHAGYRLVAEGVVPFEEIERVAGR